MSINNGVIDVNTATSSSLGVVQPDNTSIVVNSSGTISAVSTLPVTIPTMTSSVNGIGRPDNTTITVDNDGVFTAALPPTMTSSVNGIGRPDNTTITVDSNGVMSAALPPTMTSSVNGIGRPDNTTITVDSNGVMSAALPPTMTSNVNGIGRPDNTTITVDSNGVMTGAKYNRPNLLDNAWFTINQRGVTSGTFGSGEIYLDRWHFYKRYTNAPTFTINSSGLSVTGIESGVAGGYLRQFFEQSLIGKTITFSVLYSDNTISSNTVDVVGTAYVLSDGKINLRYVDSGDYSLWVYFDADCTIRAIKMEIGAVSTLSLDMEPNYTSELLKCQRYFVRINGTNAGTIISNGYVLNSTDSNILLRLPVPMASTPTVTSAGTFALKGGSISDISNIALESASDNQSIAFNCTGSSLVSNSNVVLYSKVAGSYIDLSAEI